MTSLTGRQWVLAARPEGEPRIEDFRLAEFDLDEPPPGSALVRVLYHTVAPGVRAKLAGDTYTAQVGVGDVIPSNGVGVVERSNTPALAIGDRVAGELAWATQVTVKPSAVHKLEPEIFDRADVPVETAIGVLGISGLTAWFGLRGGGIEPGNTVLISSASGPVGSTAGQIARIQGCQVIGIAGSAEKCAELVEVFGFHTAIDYRSEADLAARIGTAAPNGIDVYFDNVGGEISEAAIANMNLFGRVVVCGQTSDYNRVEPHGLRSMTRVITRRLTLRGFVVHDFATEFDVARRKMAEWLRGGQLRHKPTILDGIDCAAAAFVGQFSRTGAGRPLIKVS